MNIIEINKLTQSKRVSAAEKKLDLNKIKKDDATVLICNALKKEYGVFAVDRILTALGIKKIQL